MRYFGIATAICAICPLAIAGVFTGVYWRMYQVSMELQETHQLDCQQDRGESKIEEECPQSFYDSCGFLLREKDDSDTEADPEYVNTKWTLILAFNSILYLCHVVFTLLMCLTALVWQLGAIGIICHNIGCLVQVFAIVQSFVYRFHKDGRQCA